MRVTESDLAAFVDSVSRQSRLRVESDLGDGFVRLKVSEAERRQAKQDIRSVEDAVIELLRNARDASARRIFVSSSRSGNLRRIVVIDDGAGIPARMQEAVFEPRVTSKLNAMKTDEWGVHGRGMALFSISQNAERARVAASEVGGGTAISAVFDVKKTPERTDQSTQCALERGEGGAWVLGAGPHNILRCTAEFAMSEQQHVVVYLGSPIEVAATLYARASKDHLRAGTSVQVDPEHTAPCTRLAFAQDAESFVAIASSLDLPLSVRSAYRIMNGNVAPLKPLLNTLKRIEKRPREYSADALMRDFRGLKVSERDMHDFRRDLKEAYGELARRYYLVQDCEPQVRISRDGIHVFFPVEREL